MPVPNTINDLSTTAGSNSPAGSETPTEGDNYIRSLSAFIALLRDKLNGTSNTGTVKSATFSGEVVLDDVTPTSSLSAGFRGMPVLSNTATATKAAVGKCYLNTGSITINNSVFAAGDAFCVYNDSASNITITDGTITTMRLGGTATTGSRTLAPRGLAHLFFPTATECVVSGAGVS